MEMNSQLHVLAALHPRKIQEDGMDAVTKRKNPFP